MRHIKQKDANNVNLGDTFHITDNLTTKQYPGSYD